jgi:D-amino-acid dehydrogenase
VQYLEPNLEVDVLGGVLYPGDCHLHPGEFMETLKTRLIAGGVMFQLNTGVTGIYVKAGKARAVIADEGVFDCDELVLAAGAWLPELCRMLGLDLLMQPGKGYSLTYPDMKKNLCRPAILSERKVALTPMGKDLRMGGTMELSGINDRVLTGRVRAIYEASKAYFPGLKAGPPELKQVWTGLRPLSPDGLPYIGRPAAYRNITIAGGHALLGLSLAAATGKLVEEIISGKKTAVNLSPFSPERVFRQ